MGLCDVVWIAISERKLVGELSSYEISTLYACQEKRKREIRN